MTIKDISNYVDEDLIADSMLMMQKIYPEYHSYLVDITNNRQYLVYACDFPDGTFYFRVNENSVSSAYKDKHNAINI